MIEIIYGHVINGNFLHQKRLSIGNGLPTHGQLSYVSLVSEDIEMGTGELLWATMNWYFCDWIFHFRKKLKRRSI